MFLVEQTQKFPNNEEIKWRNMYTLIQRVLLSLYHISGTLLDTEEARGASEPWPPKGFEGAGKMQLCLSDLKWEPHQGIL